MKKRLMRNDSNIKSLLQKSILDISFILAILTVFVYLAGRIYTEQYYGQFATNYRSLDFSAATYMFNGWNVVSTSIIVLILTILILLRYFTTVRSIIISVITLVIVWVIVWVIALEVTIFRPTFPFDLVTQVVCLVVTACLLWFRQQPIEEGIKRIIEWVNAKRVPFPVILLTALFILWLYILVMTSIIAWQHAQRAKDGGMGITITQLIANRTELKQSKDASCWWLLLTRTDDDGRVLLYRETPQDESILVKNDAIALTRNYSDTETLYECDKNLAP